ncbi:glycosyltransferase [Bacillus hwajinpoensis]|uniref:Glycosyltransferase n=1 Tax=Guptibacillus hwajinpoensis TaxID=208199 RepID=A0A845EY85_9BACL|nr:MULTISPECIES: glycosyltransferase family 4 protein [Bacillaceae]MYL63562.1 glycosyltransferase [Pseudalkalibacillus hwajinpoensis]PFG12743.1 glycosyl transferase family 1 [Bacillus sp. es.036]
MKFTFPILTLCKGGAQRMLAELANGLVDRGHEVIILMPSSGVIEYSVQADIKRIPNSYELKEQDYPKADVIVSNYYTLVNEAQKASLNQKGIHIRLSLCYEPTFLPKQDLSFPSYHVTPHLLVLSKWHRDLIQLNHGIKGKIVPVGISKDFHNQNIRSQNKVPNVTAIIRKPEGGFSWHREQEYLLNQLMIVRKANPEVQLTLITPPNELYTSPTLQSIKASGLYTFRTPAEDQELAYYYNQSDIFVNSSTYDTASLPSLEAMKCGAALVTTYNGGNADYCADGINSLISFRYEDRLCSDILKLLNQPNLRRKLAQKGEEEAAKWTWNRSVQAMEEAITQLLKTT